MGVIAILGGTGPEGLGLGLRFALCGDEIRIGSRVAGRAEEAARQATERLRGVGCHSAVRGFENAAAVEGADVVVLAFPYAGVKDLLGQLAPLLAGKLVVDVVNPLVRQKGVFRVVPVPAGSAAEEIQAVLPGATVVSAFKHQSAEELVNIDHPLEGDVLICSDHADARERVVRLTARIERVRPVDAGPLINARFCESITALLLNLNRQHRAVTSIQILGLAGSHEAPQPTS